MNLRLAGVLVLAAACSKATPETRAPTESAAQTKAVIATVQSLLDALRQKDVTAAARLLAAEARFVMIDERGHTSWSTRAEFLASLPRLREPIDERIWNAEVQVHDALATVWAPYDVHRNGAFSHCGFDAFQLVHARGAWQVISIAYSERKTHCPQ